MNYKHTLIYVLTQLLKKETRNFSKALVLLVFFSGIFNYSFAEPIKYSGSRMLIGEQVLILNDSLNKYTAQEAFNATGYYKSTAQAPNFDISASTYWIKFSIRNDTKYTRLLLELEYALIDTCNLYKIDGNNVVLLQAMGAAKRFDNRKYKYPDFVFDINLDKDSVGAYLLKIKSSEQLLTPLILDNMQFIGEVQSTKDVIYGILMGILLVMMLYNFFVYLSTKDRSYLYYVLYILFIGLAQVTITGYAYKYLFPGSPVWFNFLYITFPALAGIFALSFMRSFLNTPKSAPRLDKVALLVMLLYAAAPFIRLAGNDNISSRFIDISGLGAVFTGLSTAGYLSFKNYRPAKFFLAAWIIFIVGMILFVMRNLNVLPYNDYTNYTFFIGTALEVTLLSFALADKINIFKKEKEESQAEALRQAQINERMIREQNVLLEQKVNERTVELRAANDDLHQAMTDLKEAESQLVESEKMASLGQLTAGIAHEINNPINFVTSNIKPLKRDVDQLIDALNMIEGVGMSNSTTEEKLKQINEYKTDIDFDYLKTEIEHLLSGINEGASRTAEIVKGLRIFSRLDEDDLKKADLNEGLDATLVLINNLLGTRIKVIKEYGEIPLVECYPGKLNQVFLNIMSNAIHAIAKHHPEDDQGRMTLKTRADDKMVYISIADNGTGMDENTKKKLFEPFFTTKDVGEGTGLGLSIAWNTINKHNGQIKVNTAIGEGTEFVLEIPIMH